MKIGRFEACCGFLVAGFSMLSAAEVMPAAQWLGYALAAFWFFNAFRVVKWGVE